MDWESSIWETPGCPPTWRKYQNRDLVLDLALRHDLSLTVGLQSLRRTLFNALRDVADTFDVLLWIQTHYLLVMADGQIVIGHGASLASHRTTIACLQQNLGLTSVFRDFVLRVGQHRVVLSREDREEDLLDHLRQSARLLLQKGLSQIEHTNSGVSDLTVVQDVIACCMQLVTESLDEQLQDLVRYEAGVLYYPKCLDNMGRRVAAWRQARVRDARKSASGELEVLRALVGDVQADLAEFDIPLVAAYCSARRQETELAQPMTSSPVRNWAYDAKNGGSTPWVCLGAASNAAQVLWAQFVAGKKRLPSRGEWLRAVSAALPPTFKVGMTRNLDKLLRFKANHPETLQYLSQLQASYLP